MRIDIDWDDAKAASNVAKHGVAFEEAMTVFRDPLGADGSEVGRAIAALPCRHERNDGACDGQSDEEPRAVQRGRPVSTGTRRNSDSASSVRPFTCAHIALPPVPAPET